MDILSILSNPTVVSLVVGGVLALWHTLTTRATTSSAAFAHALDAARSAARSIVATVAPDASSDDVAAKVLGGTMRLLDAAGVNTQKLSPLAAAAINAVVHDAVTSFVTSPTPPPAQTSPALHAAIVNLSLNPPAKAA